MTRPSLAIRWLAVLAILASCVGCDQFTKRVAQAQLKGQPERTYLGGMVRLQYAENPGAFLGLGSGLPESARWGLLIALNLAITAALVGMLLVRRMSALRLAACALLLSGAVGNLIDRVRFDGLVIDFLNLGLGPLRSGIFNVADVAITCGALILLVSTTSTRPVAASVEQA